MSEWKKVRLGDVCYNITSGGTPKSTNAKYYNNGSIPWLNTKEVRFNRIYSTEKYITQSGFDNSSVKWIDINSIIVAMYGATAGKVAITKIPLTTNQACCNLTIDKSKADYYFIYYYLLNNYAKIASLANGGAQQNLNSNHIKEFKVLLPSLEEQGRIAGVLGALDDKIELNSRMNRNLEEQAQALFRRWFVDFEFPDPDPISPTYQQPYKSSGGTFIDSPLGLIPTGWKVGTLLEIANYLNGLAMQKFRPLDGEQGIPVLKIKELGQRKCSLSSELCSESIKEEYIVNDGDVVFSWSGTLMIDIWCGGKCGLNQHLFKITSSCYSKWFYLQWTKYHLDKFIKIAKDKAVTMGHIKREDLQKSLVLIPDSLTFNKMNKLMNPLLAEQVALNIENRTLSQLRDSLLPKLMSGEIRV